MKSYNFSHKGKREINEDCFLERQLTSKSSIYIVADGMGGYSNGDMAAKIVTESILTHLANDKSKKSYISSIKKATMFANQQIRKISNQMNVKMGATFAALYFTPRYIFAFWMGDVRIYQFQNSDVVFQSKDHSMVNELLKERSLSPTEIERYSPFVTKCISGESFMGEVEIIELQDVKNSVFLICSDGFHKTIDPTQISLEELKSEEKLNTIACNSQDNLTFILIEG
jgi:serine/threonine protein phosphatase PrpC